MSFLKRFFKRNSRNLLFKALSRFGLAINRLYENRNYNIQSNGELNLLNKLRKFKPHIVFDVGANLGNYSNIARHEFSDAEIYAFEPVEESFQQLNESTKNDTSIHSFQIGLSQKSGKKDFYIYQQSEHNSSIEIQGMNRQLVHQLEVDTMSGDEFMRANHIEIIDLLKIDVEGTEMDVIKGFSTAFSEKRIKICQFEYGYANITSHTFLLDFYQFFNNFGYRVGKIYPEYVDFRDYHVKQEDFLGPNYLAVEESNPDLINLLNRKRRK